MESSEIGELRRQYFNAYRDGMGPRAWTSDGAAEAAAAAKAKYPDPVPAPRMIYFDDNHRVAWRVVEGKLQNNARSGEWTDSHWTRENLVRLIDLYDNPLDQTP